MINPFTAHIPKPHGRGTITITGEEYDEIVRRARNRALRDAADIAIACLHCESYQQIMALSKGPK